MRVNILSLMEEIKLKQTENNHRIRNVGDFHFDLYFRRRTSVQLSDQKSCHFKLIERFSSELLSSLLCWAPKESGKRKQENENLV